MLTAEELIRSIIDAEDDAEFRKEMYGSDDPQYKQYSYLAARERDELEERFGITKF